MNASQTFTSLLLRRRAAEETAGLPALLAAARDAVRAVAAGAHARRRAGAGDAFWQFRDYHRGDRPQDINWRQSAKGDRSLVRQNKWQTAQTALFWCAGGPGMAWRSRTDLPTKREAALILALGLGVLLAEAGEQIGPLDGSRRPLRHDAALDALGEALLGGEERALPPSPVLAGRKATLVLTGDFLQPAEEIAAALSRLADGAAGGLVLHVLDPAELDLPYDGRAIFTSPGDGMRYPVAHVAAVRDAYRARMTAHCTALEAACRRFGWQYRLHRTDRPVRETLAALAEAMAFTATDTT